MAGEAKPPEVRGASRTLGGDTDPNRLGKRLSNEGHGFTVSGKFGTGRRTSGAKERV